MLAGAHELDVIDHDHLEPVVRARASRLRAQLHDRKAWRVVDEDRQVRERRRGLRVEHVAGAQREQIGAAVHREEARHDLLGIHLEREHERGMAALGHVEGHREPQARLADRGARRDDDEVAGGEALGVEVDLAET